MSNLSVAVNVSQDSSGNVACHVTYDGRLVVVTFTPADILVDVPSS